VVRARPQLSADPLGRAEMPENSHRMSRLAVALAVASVVATAALYSLALVPLLLSGVVAVTPSRPVVYAVFSIFLGITVVRGVLVHRLPPNEQAYLRFWVHAPFFTFLVASVLGSLPILLALSAGPALGWSPGTMLWVVRAIGLTVAVLAALLVRALWHCHQASLESSPPGPGARAA
jgi:hypothetical protein